MRKPEWMINFYETPHHIPTWFMTSFFIAIGFMCGLIVVDFVVSYWGYKLTLLAMKG